ncbi:MAG TPA: hypothetical protein DCY13_00325, partial [Verrucomicrobiales bacterium]|nr:hypothetical protein [Verrucomicrobiales bacterium]
MSKVSPENSSFYRDWRRGRGLPAALHEGGDSPPPERLLQAIWARQRLRREQLVTVDGRPVEVLHPGFWNREAGPDFRDAMIRVGDSPPVSGDVEVDLQSGGWRAHRHDVNPAFRNVILHVVWANQGTPAPDRPTLEMQGRLDSPLGELQELLEGEMPPPLAEAMQGRCSAPLRALAPEQLRSLLRDAARIRLESRANQLRARARSAGWEQALTEGMLRALGYKHNAWPMQRLGELSPRLRSRLEAEGCAHQSEPWQAL